MALISRLGKMMDSVDDIRYRKKLPSEKRLKRQDSIFVGHPHSGSDVSDHHAKHGKHVDGEVPMAITGR